MKPFQLDEAIGQWVRRLRKNPGFDDADVLEMENHIRDRVDHLLIEGLAEDRAFEQAVAEFGEPDVVSIDLSISKRPDTVSASLFSLLPGWLKIFYRSALKNKFYHIR